MKRWAPHSDLETKKTHKERREEGTQSGKKIEFISSWGIFFLRGWGLCHPVALRPVSSGRARTIVSSLAGFWGSEQTITIVVSFKGYRTPCIGACSCPTNSVMDGAGTEMYIYITNTIHLFLCTVQTLSITIATEICTSWGGLGYVVLVWLLEGQKILLADILWSKVPSS